MNQSADTILMVRPVRFRSNEETASDNHYQQTAVEMTPESVNAQAQNEFDAMVAKIRAVGINVVVLDDRYEANTPDSIFPNNWISTHHDGRVITYPMYTQNRRAERRVEDVMKLLLNGSKIESNGPQLTQDSTNSDSTSNTTPSFKITSVLDYSKLENDGEILEGTGSMIFDHKTAKCYCALSARATEDLVRKFCKEQGYTPVIFHAFQTVGGGDSEKTQRLPIYHTNVMMSVGSTFAAICLDAIDDVDERKMVAESLSGDGKDVIVLTEDQINSFAGNMLQVHSSSSGINYLIMSSRAYDILTPEQIKRFETHCTLLHTSLTMIERCGGGSARCMMAEIFLPRAD